MMLRETIYGIIFQNDKLKIRYFRKNNEYETEIALKQIKVLK